ncbi:hypothetical protein COLO4_22501 [Corchorus olitorius]|uniref:BFN domain-containing protein n=1 Tax=Corchorus olitorius TaxID=93759 RepID=A0A1R3ILM0_9ROSI|nr:hypothetical protein COLO4_22501 [Corchorus olitorius]
MAQLLEFGSRVEKRREGYIPVRNLNLQEYLKYKEANKMLQLTPLVLDNPSSFPVKKDNKNEEEEEAEMNLPSSSERVAPKNPRGAVYGRGFDDVAEFFNSDKYQPADKKSEGPRKLFTKEEKQMLNMRVPDLAAATSGKWLPLHTLAASGEFYLVDAVLKHNIDINAVDKNGLAAIHKAIIGKKQAVTNYLLRESANPFIRDEDGWTPLHLAVQSRRTDTVKLLLIRGADKTLKNKDGLTPLDLCLYSGRDTRTYELIKLLKYTPKSRSLAALTRGSNNFDPQSSNGDNQDHQFLEASPGESDVISVDARPSDAINVANRCKAPIYVNKQIVLADAIRIGYGMGRVRDTKSTYDVSLDSNIERQTSEASQVKSWPITRLYPRIVDLLAS